MFFPTEITTFDEYTAFIERMLGSEVQGDIELTKENFNDIITLSMKEFYRYFQSESLSTKVYVIETQSGKGEYKMDDLMIYKRDESFGEHKLVPVQPEIFNVLDISEFKTYSSMMAMGGGGGTMNADFMFFFSGSSGSGIQGMEKAQMALDQMRNADYIKKLFSKKYHASFNRADGLLTIFPTPRVDGFTGLTVAEYNGFEQLVNNEMFWKLTIANAKKQWTSNFMKYDDISLNGGGKIDFKAIRQEGREDHAEIKQEMEDMRPPMMFFVD